MVRWPPMSTVDSAADWPLSCESAFHVVFDAAVVAVVAAAAAVVAVQTPASWVHHSPLPTLMRRLVFGNVGDVGMICRRYFWHDSLAAAAAAAAIVVAAFAALVAALAAVAAAAVAAVAVAAAAVAAAVAVAVAAVAVAAAAAAAAVAVAESTACNFVLRCLMRRRASYRHCLFGDWLPRWRPPPPHNTDFW
jgi:hypothetical protein